jgi:hypothetical protein
MCVITFPLTGVGLRQRGHNREEPKWKMNKMLDIAIYHKETVSSYYSGKVVGKA